MFSISDVILKKINIILALVILLLFACLWRLKTNYDTILNRKETLRNKNGFIYKIINNGSDNTRLIVVDLLGINFLSQKIDDTLNSQMDTSKSQLIIYQLKNSPAAHLSNEMFLNIISTEQGVVLADNFCIQNWEQLKDKEIYKKTSLTPGPYCFSEPQTKLVDQLIKKHRVSDAIILYDTNAYLELIRTFLTYLDEAHISYQLKKTGSKNEQANTQ